MQNPLKVLAIGFKSRPYSSFDSISCDQLRSFLPHPVGATIVLQNCLIPSTYHQCVKGRLSGRLIRISANPSPFNKREVKFVENMFYNKLALDDECPASGTSGAHVLEEEEGGNTHGLRDPLDRKRQKKETSSLGSQECVVVREPGGRLICCL